MGEVYEAEHLDHGRRVALKVLHRRQRRARDRSRFLAEGRLAASVCHPHCVYVFETDDIGGIPVIAMECVAGGTLKDRVVTGGPLEPGQAVDALLQVVDGLEAAHAAGILHRDVNPSNCFVGDDGLVKVGDFGLSRSIAAHGPAGGAAGFEGTPDFAAPEQFDGAVPDVRADIYAVGATLFFLLTGSPPFEGRDLEDLIARIRTAPLHIPRSAPPLPTGLVTVMRQCLAKDPVLRPGSYAELRKAVAPFAKSATRPAPRGLRIAATAYDVVVIGILMSIVIAGLVAAGATRSGSAVVFLLFLGATLYWGALEGTFGAGYGKRRCGLRVVDPHGRPPGVVRVLLRSLVCALPVVVPVVVRALVSGVVTDPIVRGVASTASGLGCLALVAPIRPRGAFLQDWLSGTHVIQHTEPVVVRAKTPESPASFAVPTRWCGPYCIEADLGTTDHGQLQRGWDPQLQRPVWIHRVPGDVRAVPGVTRSVSRGARLHWLNGRRRPSGGWDAYDALDGRPLLAAVGSQPWSAVRAWLADLARELEASLADSSMDTVDMTRVWMTADGRAKLLPFSAPKVVARRAASRLDVRSGQQFLHGCAVAAIGPSAEPLPLSVTMCLSALARGEFASLGQAASELERLAAVPDSMTPSVRGMSLALGVVTYLATAVGVDRLLAHVGPSAPTWLAVGVPFGLAQVYGRVGYAVLGVVSACWLRSGVWLRAFGVAVVTRDGMEVSRVRAAFRAVAAWSWVPLHIWAATLGHGAEAIAFFTLAGVAYAASSPVRGWQDRVAGTYLVPR